MYQTPSLLIIHLIRRSSNTGGCESMGTLGNVPLASAHGHCTVAALSCILKWKTHHKFHVSPVVFVQLNYLISYITGQNISDKLGINKAIEASDLIYGI